jgi:hypothetical protein
MVLIDMFEKSRDLIKSGLNWFFTWVPKPIFVTGTLAAVTIPAVYDNFIKGMFWLIRKAGDLIGQALFGLGNLLRKMFKAGTSLLGTFNPTAAAKADTMIDNVCAKAIKGLLTIAQYATIVTDKVEEAFASRNVRIATAMFAIPMLVGIGLSLAASWFPVIMPALGSVYLWVSTLPIVGWLVQVGYWSTLAAGISAFAPLVVLVKGWLVTALIQLGFNTVSLFIESSKGEPTGKIIDVDGKLVDEATGKSYTADQLIKHAKNKLATDTNMTRFA